MVYCKIYAIKSIKRLCMFNDRNEAFKSEFMMVQSCERRRDEMYYKNVNRKYLNFNLENNLQMAQVGKALKPFGFVQNLQHKAVHSRLEWFRIWAEARLARRGAKYLRRLYRENPEKFFDINFKREGSPVTELSQCKYILSDNTSQKTISLVSDEGVSGDMLQIRKELLSKEKTLEDEQKLAKEFTPEAVDEPQFGIALK
jgi:hypothetical protein